MMEIAFLVPIAALALVTVVGWACLRAALITFAAGAGDRRARYRAGLTRLRPARGMLLAGVLAWVLTLPQLIASDASIARMLLQAVFLFALCAAGSWPFLRYRAHAMGRSLGVSALTRVLAGQVIYQAVTLLIAGGLLAGGIALCLRATSTPLAVAEMVAALLLDVTVVFVLYPYLVRLLSRARPVTDPAVLSMLDELNRTCGTSVDRLWLLSSPTGSLNAMVTGVSRRRPTIFVTDALLASFSLADLRAILAHELAHVRRRHILRALGNSWMGVVVYMGLFMLVWTVVSKVSGQTPGPLAVAAMVFVASLVTDLGVRLPLGRRRESEADQLAASWVGGEALAGALERLYGANLAAADFSLTEKIWASHPTLRTRLSQLNRG